MFTKAKALCQLKHVIVLAEDDIKNYLELIIRTMKRCYQREEKQLVDLIKDNVELLGIYVDIDLNLQIFLKLLYEEDTRASPRLISNLLVSSFTRSGNFTIIGNLQCDPQKREQGCTCTSYRYYSQNNRRTGSHLQVAELGLVSAL